tara:strand:- start:88 stop:1737 length:1650 start_codon:yes stop_codon:yes gene_type:complete
MSRIQKKQTRNYNGSETKTQWLYVDASGNTIQIDESQVTMMSIEDYVRCEIANDIFGNREGEPTPFSTRGGVSVRWLYEMYNIRTLETGSREYQREKVATLQFKQDMIKTILCRPWSRIPEVHIRVIVNKKGVVSYEIVDGQQRIAACIIGFLKDEFKLPKGFMAGSLDLSNMNGSDVRNNYPHLYEQILNYRITNTWYENLTDEMTSDLFVEVLNKTNDMKPQEKRNAIRGFLSSYIRDNSRYETHELFTRNTLNVGKKNEKQVLKYLPKLALAGRMEADEFLSQLLYGLFKGWSSGVTNKSITDWVTDTQREGAENKVLATWNTNKKSIDEFMTFCLSIVKVVGDNHRAMLTKNMAFTLLSYGYEKQQTYGKLDKQKYVDWFFDVHTRWSDIGLGLYANHTFPHDNKKALPQFNQLFGGLNKNAIGAQIYVLDLELKQDKSKAGVIELDSRASFSKSDINRKFFEQGQKCFFTGEQLNISDIAGDHYIARSLGIERGGLTEYHNLVITSPALNNDKDNKSPEEFHKFLQKRGYEISTEFETRLQESK